jgi:hypothetical protein
MRIRVPSTIALLSRSRHRQGGMAVIVMLVLLSIILIYTATNIRSLYRLERELKLTDQRQVRRLSTANRSGATPSVTNAPSATATNPQTADH